MLKPLLLCLCASAATAQDVVILGEVHDNPDAHLAQAAALRRLSPTAVVFEMLTADAAAQATKHPSTLPDLWQSGGWSNFDLYAPIFDSLGDAQIIGAAVPRTETRAVYSAGAASAFGPEAERFGLTDSLPPAQQTARETLQFDAHCQAMPREMMAGMVEIQRLRDARMAQATLDALDRFGPPVAVITGNGHARTDWGVPAVIARAAPQVTTRAIAHAEHDDGTPYDAIKNVPIVDREDPCAAFNE